MKKTFFVFAFLIFYQVLYAQQDSTQTKPPNEKNYQIYTWDIGVDLRNLIYSGSRYVSVRRNFSKIKSGGKVVYRANRLGLYINYTDLDYLPTYLSGKDLYVGLTFGKEYQKPLGRFQFFYGADITPIFQVSHYVLANNPDNSTSNYRFGFNSAVFTGCKFFIHSRFMLSWEMAGQFYRNPHVVIASNTPSTSVWITYGFEILPARTVSFHFFFK